MFKNTKTSNFEIVHTDKTLANIGNHLLMWSEFLFISEANCMVISRSGYSEIAASLKNRFGKKERCWIYFFDCDKEENLQKLQIE